MKTFILVLEALEKRRVLRSEYRASPPEATASIFNRSFFWWLNPLFFKGFSSLLRIDDLFVVDKQMRSDYVHERMEQAYNKGALLSVQDDYLNANDDQSTRSHQTRCSWCLSRP